MPRNATAFPAGGKDAKYYGTESVVFDGGTLETKKKNGASANMWIHSLRIPYPNLSGVVFKIFAN